MSALPRIDTGSGSSLSRASMLHSEHGAPCTKRVAELEARIGRLRAELEASEAELQRERARLPEPGDFVRCPLTNFFGRVTRVTPRPQGRPWIEIVLYLSPGLAGHSTLDLFDSWELIDPPGEGASSASFVEPSPRLPAVSSFKALDRPLAGHKSVDDIELLIGNLWTRRNTDTL
jgi:hypothetical protein